MNEKMLKSISLKKPNKEQREQLVLMGLIKLYIQSGKPIGSNTLRENGFSNLSSATIRNYFATLEEQGYLHQQHSSGGRSPTTDGYKAYADFFIDQPPTIDFEIKTQIKDDLQQNTNQVHPYLLSAIETLSEITNCAVIISAPRFDQDFIKDIKLIEIDEHRLLCVLITDFGLIKTETLYLNDQIEDISSLEKYFLWRMSKTYEKPYFINEIDAKWAQRLYNEVVVRHLAGYIHFFKEDLFRTGLSKLLTYPEFSNAQNLSDGLRIFEDESLIQTFLQKTLKKNKLNYLIGDGNKEQNSNCSLIAIPYYLNQTPVGSIGLLMPTRAPYGKLFGILQLFSYYLSKNLTKNIYKFKIHFRKPSESSMDQEQIHANQSILLEDQSCNTQN